MTLVSVVYSACRAGSNSKLFSLSGVDEDAPERPLLEGTLANEVPLTSAGLDGATEQVGCHLALSRKLRTFAETPSDFAALGTMDGQLPVATFLSVLPYVQVISCCETQIQGKLEMWSFNYCLASVAAMQHMVQEAPTSLRTSLPTVTQRICAFLPTFGTQYSLWFQM